MILCIEDVLSAGDLEAIRGEIARSGFRDGRATAGWSARRVKNNLQMEAGDPCYERVAGRITAALRANEVFMQAALPRALRPPLISRSDVGMGYGRHMDDALMGEPYVRTDLAYTLFLSAPDAYEGGELVIESASGELDFKLAAGGLVLYPATYLHKVEIVRAGTRLVAVGWAQCCVRDAGRRELLFDLQRARRMVLADTGGGEAFDLMSKACGNLLRLWSEV
ncbi:Fe2+-dependent dioxygenase [Phenylobacterium sp.]|uniref:Fe2+-dependent dioxygenase n=1 Tax=Phenylobacterium sp. TaxID=1871053 RepID=UPI002FCC9B69